MEGYEFEESWSREIVGWHRKAFMREVFVLWTFLSVVYVAFWNKTSHIRHIGGHGNL